MRPTVGVGDHHRGRRQRRPVVRPARVVNRRRVQPDDDSPPFGELDHVLSRFETDERPGLQPLVGHEREPGPPIHHARIDADGMTPAARTQRAGHQLHQAMKRVPGQRLRIAFLLAPDRHQGKPPVHRGPEMVRFAADACFRRRIASEIVERASDPRNVGPPGDKPLERRHGRGAEAVETRCWTEGRTTPDRARRSPDQSRFSPHRRMRPLYHRNPGAGPNAVARVPEL